MLRMPWGVVLADHADQLFTVLLHRVGQQRIEGQEFLQPGAQLGLLRFR